MKNIIYIFIIVSFSLSANQLPWDKVADGNQYWAAQLGIPARAPKAISTHLITTQTNLNSDASIRLIDAVLDYQIAMLNSNELRKFADSLQHLIIYTSGAWPKTADSYNRAGWWNLSYPIAMRYGLTINDQIDERLDFEKSTRAAMAYIKDLQKNLPANHYWMHAFVASPVAIARDSGNLQDTLRRNLFAMQQLLYNSQSAEAEQYAVANFYKGAETYKTKNMILADLIIEKTGLPRSTLYTMNPWLRSNEIPAKSSLKLPPLAYEKMKKVEEDVVLLSQARIEEKKNPPVVEKAKQTVYIVKSGDNLGLIAQRNGVGLSELKQWNNLRSDVIYAGQKLIIYADKPLATAPAPKPKTETSTITSVKADVIEYSVKPGDTLWSIARQFPGVSPDNIMSWNGIDTNIKEGQKLKILKAEVRN